MISDEQLKEVVVQEIRKCGGVENFLSACTYVKYMTVDLHENVDRGAKWLDEHYAGWESQINLPDLKMDYGDRCICGQLFLHQMQHFNDTEDALYSDGYAYACEEEFGIDGLYGEELGFDFIAANNGSDCAHWQYEELAHIWVDLISARLKP